MRQKRGVPANSKRPKRNGPVKVDLPFDEAIRRALRVPPPPEGWAVERRAEQIEKPRRKRAAG